MKGHLTGQCRLNRIARLIILFLPIWWLGCSQDSNQPPESSQEKTESIVDPFGEMYNADPMSLFSYRSAGIYKKKIQIGDEIRNAMVFIWPERIETRVDISSGCSLQFGFVVFDASGSKQGDRVQLTLSLKDGDKSARLLTLPNGPTNNNKKREWSDVKLDLKNYAGRAVTLVFEVSGLPESTSSSGNKKIQRKVYAVISEPKIVVAKPETEHAAENIVLISIDTLRADHLGCTGYKRKDISPNIDKLAQEGILFENTISPSPWTTPSHMSLFTSLLPSYHRVNEGFERVSKLKETGLALEDAISASGYRILPQNVMTFPEILKSKGYVTAAYTGGGCVHGNLGFCKGFDTYNNWPDPLHIEAGMKKVTKFLETNKHNKFFLFLHTYKCHSPYTSYKYASEVMTGADIEKLKNVKLKGDNQWRVLKEHGLFRKEVTEALYDGEIFEVDRQIGILMDNLERLGLNSRTIVIFTSDHGEEFGEHNIKIYNGHGYSVYDEVIKVPLIFKIPGFQRGVRIEQQVRLIDIVPTLFELAGIRNVLFQMQGVSLFPALKGQPIKNELPAISEALNTGPEMKSIRIGRWKYIYTVNIDKFGERILISDHPDREELYDLKTDPGEQHDLHLQKQNLCLDMKKRINGTLKKATTKPAKDKRIGVDHETMEQLKSLGYVQ